MLIIGEQTTGGSTGSSTAHALRAAGYQTAHAPIGAGATEAIREFEPDVVIMDLNPASFGESGALSLARRLRREPATYALPIVFIWTESDPSLRAAAANLGVDDYFSRALPSAQMVARLDSLFWRIEAGRRSAAVVGDQRLEIDNFMLLLDVVRADLRAGATGALALVYAVAPEGSPALDRVTRDRALAEAHGFLKLYLRRADTVSFYGPGTLLVYMPRMTATEAATGLSGLRRDFLGQQGNSDIAVGVASFPDAGADVETVIERAEEAAGKACSGDARHRVISHAEQEEAAGAPAETRARAAAADEAAPATAPGAPVPNAEFSLPYKPVDAVTVRESSRKASETEPVSFHSGGADEGEAVLAARAASLAAARERERRAGGAVMPRRLLLTISDAERMAQLNLLIRAAGYEARAAFDGQQALDLLRIERPDLVLLDYELHGINGIEMLRRLRKQQGGTVAVPVVMLLPVDHETKGAEALELGARKVVAMPCDPADLLASIRVAGSA